MYCDHKEYRGGNKLKCHPELFTPGGLSCWSSLLTYIYPFQHLPLAKKDLCDILENELCRSLQQRKRNRLSVRSSAG